MKQETVELLQSNIDKFVTHFGPKADLIFSQAVDYQQFVSGISCIATIIFFCLFIYIVKKFLSPQMKGSDKGGFYIIVLILTIFFLIFFVYNLSGWVYPIQRVAEEYIKILK